MAKGEKSFIDNVRIFVKAGSGGNGCLSFRREKFVPKGGPDGGNGGKGGDIYFKASRDLTTLLHLARNPHIKAEDGANGKGSFKDGKSAGDITIFVPCGTVIKENTKIIADLDKHANKVLIAKGGRGGRGNASFKTQLNTAPRISEKGASGENKTLELELKLLADVGLTGLPNAGKSTLLSAISAARPKIADYPFTTLSPSLGIVSHKNKNFVACDIPGLIEGAHKGKGLGDKFLRHIERTRILLIMVDPLGFGKFTPKQSVKIVLDEIKNFSPELTKREKIIVVNKSDLPQSYRVYEKIKKRYPKQKVFLISAVTGEGISKLLDEIIKTLSKTYLKTEPLQKPEVKIHKLEPAFEVCRTRDGTIEIKGNKITELIEKTNFDQPESVVRLEKIFKKIGIDKKLKKLGVKEGDIIKISGTEFIWKEKTHSIDERAFSRRRKSRLK